MARYFVFLYVENSWLAKLFNLAIFSLNPREKWPAHITLAGPYKDLRSVPKNIEYSRKVSVIGAGQFRSEKQNTVFLHVGTPDLRDVWDKPEYPFKPHMTIYDGSDNDLGDTLMHHLRVLRPFLKFYVTQLHVVKSEPGQSTFDLRTSVDTKLIPETAGMTLDHFDRLTNDERIKIAVSALREATNAARVM